jgi:hypothetical protein
LAHNDRRRWHVHFTPTSSSWFNLIERWFKELTDKDCTAGHSRVWSNTGTVAPNRSSESTAEDIIAKVVRGRATLNHIKSQTEHQAVEDARKPRYAAAQRPGYLNSNATDWSHSEVLSSG